jgi:uncharacterized protein
MVTMKVIDDFLMPRKFAFAGLSRNPKSFSRQAFASLSEKEYEIIPVNPNTEEIEGKKCYKSIEELPRDVDRILFMTPKSETDKLFTKAIERGMKSIWIQQGSETKETIDLAKEKNFDNLVSKHCIFMFTEPTGIHKFHRFIMKLIGLLPK